MRVSFCSKIRWLACVVLVLMLGLSSFSVFAVPRYVYTANYYGSTVSIYRVDSETGMLRHLSHVPTVKSPSTVTLHPSGKFLYAVSQAIDEIAIYRVNAKTGALTETAESRVSAGVRSTFQLLISPDGKYLYTPGRFTSDFVIHRINQETGALTKIEGTDFDTRGRRARFIALTPNNKFVYVANTDSDSIAAYMLGDDRESATPVPGMPFQSGDAPQQLLMHPSGKYLYAGNWRSGDMSAFFINAETGELTPMGGERVEAGFYPFKGSMHPTGKYLYVANWASSDVSGFSINQQTGALTPMASNPMAVAGRGSPVTAQLDKAGKHAYVPDYDTMDLKVFDVDPQSGELVNQRRVMSRPGVREVAILEGDAPVRISTQWLIAADRKKNTIDSYAFDEKTADLRLLHQLKLDYTPDKMAVNADAGIIYVANKKTRRIEVYGIDQQGLISKQTEATVHITEGVPVALRVNARGSHLYVITQAPNQYLAYAIGEKGRLNESERVHLPADSKPVAVTATPEERLTFVLDGVQNRIYGYRYLYASEAAMFELKHHGSPFAMAEGLSAMAFEPFGRFALVVSSDAATVSSFALPGRWAPLKPVKDGTLSVGQRPVAVSIANNGRDVYVLDAGKRQIQQLRLNSQNGSLKNQRAVVSLKDEPAGLQIDPAGRFAYLRYASRTGVTRFEIDGEQGRLTNPTELLGGLEPSALVFTATVE